MTPIFDSYENWAGGVTTSPSKDMLPDGSSPRGRNTTLVHIGQGTAQVGARKGVATGNATPITSSPVMLGQYQLKRLDGTKTHLLVSDGGRLDKYNSDATTSTINATAFTSGTHYPNFTTVNNMAIIANGVDLKKTDGTTVWQLGITRPAAAPTVAAAAGGSMSVGTRDVALTYFNSTTGQESSLSDFNSATLSGGNLSVNISWTAPSDPQVDFVRIYIRNPGVGANFYLAIAGLSPAPNATWNGFAVATTSTVANISDTIYAALAIIAPTTTGNNPPAVTLQYPVWHHSRLFLFDSGNAYYSNITNLASQPESFDPNNSQAINPADGDTIVGAASVFDTLFIFKKFSLWAIVGYDPTSWTVTQISDKYGCAGHRSIAVAGGALYWWANTSLGLLTLTDAASQPLEVGKELLFDTISDTALNTLALNICASVVDEANDIVAFALPGAGSTTRNTVVLPFNYRVKRFVADMWTPMDIASWAVVEDASSTKQVYAGGYSGQIFHWWAATNDGVPSGTSSGIVTSGSTDTTLVDALATFNTTGGKLVERYVYHTPKVGPMQRRRITANTGTTLTITPAWDTTLVVGDPYIIGGIDWQLDTPESNSGAPFFKKRYEYLFIQGSSAQNGALVKADVFCKGDFTTPTKTISFTLNGTGAIYGSSSYGAARYAASNSENHRKAMGLTGQSYLIRLRQMQPDIQITLQRIAVQGSVLSPRT